MNNAGINGERSGNIYSVYYTAWTDNGGVLDSTATTTVVPAPVPAIHLAYIDRSLPSDGAIPGTSSLYTKLSPATSTSQRSLIPFIIM